LVGQSCPSVDGGVVNGDTHLIYLDKVWEIVEGRDNKGETEDIGIICSFY
jgi:hypothetical protein